MRTPFHPFLPGLLARFWTGILTVLGKRHVYYTLLFLFLAAGGSVAAVMLAEAKRIQDDERLLSVQPFRNGFVALSDLMRLNNLLLDAESAVTLAPGWRRGIQNATDILYVRYDTFRNELIEDYAPKQEAEAVAALKSLVDFMDVAMQAGLGRDAGFDYPAFLANYLALADVVRAKLVLYLDEADHEQDALLAHRTGVVVRQAQLQAILASGLSLLACLALAAIRAEAVERLHRREAQARARYLAYFDPLTGLANRISFQEGAEERLAKAQSAATLLLDLDNFKGINDTLGHAAGDLVLKETARRLKRATMDGDDLVARLSGDEFAIFAADRSPEQLQALGDRIVAECAKPIIGAGFTINPGVSVGIATDLFLTPGLPPGVGTLTRLADFALYASKTAGRGCATLADPAIVRRFTEYRTIIEDLRAARESERLEVFLQPKIRLADGTLAGFEALVRWRREGQIIRPDTFIEIAERNGMVKEIDHFMLERSAWMLATHNAAHDTNISVSVNLSALNLNSDHILGVVDAVLESSGLPPDLLTLEVTETAMIRNRGDAEAILRQLSARGVRISVDDFGAGHASLIYVRTLRPDELKIDQSLVREIATNAEARLVLDRMISVGLGLGMDVVTEGIETEAERDIVTQMGATYGQGYFWSKPRPALEVLSELGRTAPVIVSGWQAERPPAADRA